MLLQEERHVPALADSTPLCPEKSFLSGSWVDAEFRSTEHVMFIVAMFTGMRQGELLGLSWDNVNFKTGQITIKQQLQCKDGVYFLETPKSGKYRVLSPAPVVMDALKDEQQQQNANKQIVGAAWENKWSLVFTDALGKNLVRRTVVKHFKAVIERANIPPDVRFHDLRHSFAVTSLYSGDDVKTVQASLWRRLRPDIKRLSTSMAINPIQPCPN